MTQSHLGSGTARNLPRLRVFLVVIAKRKGLQLPPGSPNASERSRTQHIANCNTTLEAWLRGLTPQKFSDDPEQRDMFGPYMHLMKTVYPELAKKCGHSLGIITGEEATVSYPELGRSMIWMVKNPTYTWLNEFFRMTMGCTIEGALKIPQSSITG